MKKHEQPFSERHPKLNLFIGIIMLLAIIMIAVLLIKFIFQLAGAGIVAMGGFLKKWKRSEFISFRRNNI